MHKHALTAVMLVALSTAAVAEPVRLDTTDMDRVTASGALGNLLGRLAGNNALLSIFGRLGLPTGGGPAPTPTPAPAPPPPVQSLDDIIAGSIIKF